MAVIVTCDRCEGPASIITWVGEDGEEIGLFCTYCGDDVERPGWLFLGIDNEALAKGKPSGTH